MKIAIDARWIFRDISGIGNYTRQLLHVYAQNPGEHTFKVLFSDPEIAARTGTETGLDQSPHMESITIPWTVFSPKSQIFLPHLLRKMGIQVFHSPNYMIPFLAFSRNGRGRIKAVTTIHDLIPLRFPDHAPQSRKSRFMPVFRGVMRETTRRSSRIVTDSQVSAQDLADLLHVPPRKIDVIPLGASENFRPAQSQEGAFKSKRDWIELVYVGRADPYKNLEQLFHVVHRLNKFGNPARLTIVGSPDPRYPEQQRCVDQLGMGNSVRWTGFIQDNELVDHINHADVMLHASRYEGFGLQIIEAMACGIPVVCSNAGSLPEVAGQAAILCHPDDTNAFVQAVLQLRDNPAERATRIASGTQQAATFSWEKTARATIACYEAAVADGGSE